MDYASSGVDIEAGNHAVQLIKNTVKKSFSPYVLNHLGGFASCVALPPGYHEPVLVSCTDGVGTKVKLAIEANQFSTIGIDLVAMCVNDLICCGAKPLFFLDYIACHQLVPEKMAQLIEGMTNGCIQANCSLVGGEMAEMNDLYQPGDFDLAGFSVGVAEKSDLLDGSLIQPGHYVYGIQSSGVHSNGYSLVRKIMALPGWKTSGISIETLLTPTRIYVQLIETLRTQATLTGLAHITGGGLAENVARVLPNGVQIRIPKSTLPERDVFKALQTVGQVSETEMYRVFNMGIGMVVISSTPLDHPECSLLAQVEPHPQDKKDVVIV